MPTIRRFVRIVFVVVLLVSPLVVSARGTDWAEGQLLHVDAGSSTIVMRTAQGSQLRCSFNRNTRVVGGDIAAAPAFTRLTVHYAREQAELVATAIEIHPARF